MLGITAIGAYLRFYNLGVPCLWVDEALLAGGHLVRQEFLTVWLYNLFHPQTEFWIRFPYALCGTLTIPAVYFAISNKKYALLACLIVATFPLFVWWSRLARPYAVIGLFMTLGWRFPLMYVVGLTISPLALIGVNLRKFNWWHIGLLVLAFCMYTIRPDTDRSFLNYKFLSNAHRMWYVPILVSVLYMFEYGIPSLESAYSKLRKR